MSSTLRELRHVLVDSYMNMRVWVLFLCGVFLFALIGPFGTFEQAGFPVRLAYWAITMLGAWAISIVVTAIIFAFVRPHWNRPLILMLIGAGVSAAPTALFVSTVSHWFFNSQTSFLSFLGYALPISLSFSALVYYLIEKDIHHETDDGDNALLQRLSPANRGPVKHMSMDDHYISVTTTRGREMVLMRMADASAALGSSQGAQVHRSHWVGREFVASSRREKGQLMIVMEDGAEIPVSRSYAKTAKALLKG